MTRRPSPAGEPASGPASRAAVVLVRPGNPENIGLVARAMKNTGFPDLRLVSRGPLSAEARRTAVHAEDILAGARLFPSLEAALTDRDFVLASTARLRRHATVVPLTEAVRTIGRLPAGARIALLFGNERTGLLSGEIERANLVFTIPQVGRQPSYNLGAAVLLTLYSLFTAAPGPLETGEPPLPRPEQDAAIALILRQLETKRFIHPGNKVHVAALTHDLLGRLAMTARDRRFLLALFAKGVDSMNKESDDDRQ
ncbi:MAG: TrmH family RNA methyltransferase [Acidobacteriota bacterium]|nr:TrmH family RNA methyltransferase [Acidobacteriota bacterium]